MPDKTESGLWKTHWDNFEKARDNEWLKYTVNSKKVPKYNEMMLKLKKDMPTLLANAEKAQTDISDCNANKGGKTPWDADKYLQTLAVVQQQLKGPILQIIVATINEFSKVNEPKTYRALKVLQTGVTQIEANLAYKVKSIEMLTAEAKKLVKVKTTTEKVMDLALDQVKKGVGTAAASIQVIKGKPNRATWDTEFNKAGRDLIMGLVSLQSAQAKGAHGNVPAAAPFKTSLDPYNVHQQSATLPPNYPNPDAEKNDILQRIKVFSGLVKAVSNAYQAFW